MRDFHRGKTPVEKPVDNSVGTQNFNQRICHNIGVSFKVSLHNTLSATTGGNSDVDYCIHCTYAVYLPENIIIFLPLLDEHTFGARNHNF